MAKASGAAAGHEGLQAVVGALELVGLAEAPRATALPGKLLNLEALLKSRAERQGRLVLVTARALRFRLQRLGAVLAVEDERRQELLWLCRARFWAALAAEAICTAAARGILAGRRALRDGTREAGAELRGTACD